MSQRVIFICIHNSARSQMAEEFLRKFGSDRFEVESAGIEPGKLNPVVVRALLEEDIKIAGKPTRSVDDALQFGQEYDYVITVCDETSAERCPVFPGNGQRLHWGFSDPSKFQGSDEEKLEQVRVVRDQIKEKIKDWLKNDSETDVQDN